MEQSGENQRIALCGAIGVCNRTHWAVRDAQLNDRPIQSWLNPDIVMEWDYALRWLVGYLDQEWDDVSLDT